MNDATKQTLLAQVYDVALRSPLDRAAKLSSQLGAKVYLKREDLQPVHSFKLRGAYNKIAQLATQEKKRGIIAASAGNHAQGVALAAQKLGISALIVMPRTTPAIKVEAVTSYGAAVELAGDSYSDAAEYCKKRTKETGRTYIHPFDDPLVIAGQGTIGREIVEQLPGVTHIFVPVGGGGLIAGIAQYVKALRPKVKIIGVEPEDSNVMQASLKAGKRITLPYVGIFADGVAVKQMGEHTFGIVKDLVDGAITVGTDELCSAIKATFEETRSIVEPAGALGVAGITKYAKSHDMSSAQAVAICSGANMTFERLQFVAERTLLGSGKEALFAVQMKESPGALRSFCRDVVDDYGITQLGYRLKQRGQAHIFVGISLQGLTDKKTFTDKMSQHGYAYIDLSYEDIAKEHVRHMIGGPSPETIREHLYLISFPERPGALADFLEDVSGIWNISLFHYRGQGADEGSVLIGFEADDERALKDALRKTKYAWKNVDAAASLRLFAE
ncbi:MAG TPA: threonine ammonia-lyase, biosynthetic [Candidatus Saccharimonadales bacterium]|nr:threonine ammonia-lyase, biosynthetic [Candidatus Saccharimonadales bacterium]